MNRRKLVLSVASLAMFVAPFASPGIAIAQEAAACPSDVVVSVAPPSADAPTTVSVTLTPEVNIQPGTSGDLTSFHLHYFVDTEASAAGTTVPTGDPNIIHSASTTQDLGELEPGEHTVTVVLGQLNHTACEARGSVTFEVAEAQVAQPPQPAAESPVPATTGNAGIAGEEGATDTGAVLLMGAMLALIAGARFLPLHRP